MSVFQANPGAPVSEKRCTNSGFFNSSWWLLEVGILPLSPLTIWPQADLQRLHRWQKRTQHPVPRFYVRCHSRCNPPSLPKLGTGSQFWLHTPELGYSPRLGLYSVICLRVASLGNVNKRKMSCYIVIFCVKLSPLLAWCRHAVSIHLSVTFETSKHILRHLHPVVATPF